MSDDRKRRVAYFYHSDIGNFHYGKDHPMKPKRIAMAHDLIVNYGMYKELNVYRPHYATREEMCTFHNPDYVKYLEIVGEKQNDHLKSKDIDLNEEKRITQDSRKYKIGEITDCPKFAGLIDFCQISTGGSIDSALLIAEEHADICINWAGGLHHAKKMEASGFCYINDIVICIQFLLRYYTRILYIDIDVHHGDGVEEAFFTTNRVMTVSFHQYGDDFFPGSGNIDCVGEGPGQYYSLNVPLKPGMNDETYVPLFKDVMSKVMESFQPSVVVMQCGADSLVNDQLGNFNMSIKGHGACVDYMLGFGVPIILLGGGGYTINNVSRCWAYETSVCLKKELDDQLPKSDYYMEYPDSRLHIQPKNTPNQNTSDSLNNMREKVSEYMRNLEFAPGIAFHQTPNITKFLMEQKDMMMDLESDYDIHGQYNMPARLEKKADPMNLI